MIELKGIEVKYGSGTDTEVCALRIPSLQLGFGSWCNLIGPNGSGKSTLLKLLSGGIDAFEGRYFISGQDVTEWKPNRLSGTVQILEQNPALNTIPSMTVEENLRLYSQSNGTLPSISFLKNGDLGKIRNLLAGFEMDLEARLFSKVGILSGGQKQAVALAAVLLRLPKVLLLDEFLAAIDAKAAPKLLATVRKAASEYGMTVLMVSHDLTHLEGTGDRLIILSDGQVADDISTLERPLQRTEILSRYSAVMKRNGVL